MMTAPFTRPPPPHNSDSREDSLCQAGSLWAFGPNFFGELSQGDLTQRISPVQVGSLSNWKEVEVGRYFSMAMGTDGTLWSFGINYTGQLGIGVWGNRSSPVQIGNLSSWTKMSAGRVSSLAIRSDRTLWSFGDNSVGQLGIGDTLDRSNPVQVGNLSSWSEVSSGLASVSLGIRADGTLWSFGGNSSGALGLGDTVSRSSPVQVGTLSNWAQISSGSSSIARRTDGTLWAFGGNSPDGSSGLGDNVNRSSPVQVGSLSSWKDLATTGSFTFARTGPTRFTLWAFGSNSYGQLGLGDTTPRSSPVQVGSLTSWNGVAGGYRQAPGPTWRVAIHTPSQCGLTALSGFLGKTQKAS